MRVQLEGNLLTDIPLVQKVLWLDAVLHVHVGRDHIREDDVKHRHEGGEDSGLSNTTACMNSATSDPSFSMKFASAEEVEVGEPNVQELLLGAAMKRELVEVQCLLESVAGIEGAVGLHLLLGAVSERGEGHIG